MRRLGVACSLVAVACGPKARTGPTVYPPWAAPGMPVHANAAPSVPWVMSGGASVEEDALRLINEYRKAAGVRPVTLDPALTKGCREHAAYMVLNRGKPQLYSLNAHHQDPTLPGATPDGADCGRNANLSWDDVDLQVAVHDWMSTLYHRRSIIAPDLVSVGIGYAPLPAGEICSALRFVFAPYGATGWPVAFPANGQVDVPVHFQSEVPNPLPRPATYGGYPITLHFPFYDVLTNANATLVDADGTPVPFFFSSREQPADEYGLQGANVGLIPKEPLRAATRYFATVNAVWAGRPITRTTSFTTMSRQELEASDEAALLAAIGKAALVRGTVERVVKINDGVVHLELSGPASLERIVQVTIEAPLERVTTDPKRLYELRGQRVEIEATPTQHLKYVRLNLLASAAFRLIP